MNKKVSTHVVDMWKYDFILNYSWLCETNSDIDWKNRNFIYYIESNKNTVKFNIELCDAEEFTQLTMLAIKKNHETYIAFSWKLIFSIFDMINDNAMRCGTMQNKNIEIFKQLKNLSEIFSKKLFYQLNAHEKMKHLINFINNKTSRLNSIYNMSQNEFAVIRNYLNDVLKKQWIRSSFSSISALVLFTKKPNGDLCFCVDYWGFNEFIIKNKYFLPLLSELLNRFTHIKRFSKIDLRWTYHQIRIRKKNE